MDWAESGDLGKLLSSSPVPLEEIQALPARTLPITL